MLFNFKMISTSLIFVLLGCASAWSNPTQENGNSAAQAGILSNELDVWLEGVHGQIKQTFLQTVQPFESTYNSLVETSKNSQICSKDKIEQLRSNFHQIIDKSRETLSDVEAIILRGRTQSLQRAVEYLSILLSSLMNQQEEQYRRILAEGKNLNIEDDINNTSETLNILFQYYQEGISTTINKIQQALKHWKTEADAFLADCKTKMEQPVQNGGMNSIFGGNRGWPKIPEGIKNITGNIGKLPNIPGFVQELPIIGQGIKNVQQATDGGLNNVANSIKQFPSIAGGLFPPKSPAAGEGTTGDIGKGTNNMAEDITQVPNNIGGLFNQNPSAGNQGKFSQLGQNAGKNIGDRLDNIAGAVGGAWKNTANMFGK